MKNLFFAALFVALPFLCFSQEKEKEPIVVKDSKGIIQSVEFCDSIQSSKIPSSSEVFFKDFLKISKNDQFKKIPHVSKRKEFTHEHFDQVYNGVNVDGAGYNFHYKNGKMFIAHGHYMKIENLIK
jgi:bacillolysin